MFRKMRRFNQEISLDKCIELLKNEPRGILAMQGMDGYPYSIPMNHFYHDGKLYFHCAKVGHKIDAINSNNKVAFTVIDKGYVKENEWALNINSVIVYGHISILEDTNKAKEIIRALGLKHYPTPESVDELIERAFSKINILELTIDHISGKLVNES